MFIWTVQDVLGAIIVISMLLLLIAVYIYKWFRYRRCPNCKGKNFTKEEKWVSCFGATSGGYHKYFKCKDCSFSEYM